MKTQSKVNFFNLKEIKNLNPVERQKVLREFLATEQNKEILKLINEEIRKAEIEEETLENLEDIQKKEEEKESNLDNLVQKFSENEEFKEHEKKIVGDVYGLHKDDSYKVYSAYNPLQQEDFRVNISSTTNSDKVTTGISEENLSSNFKKMTELYNKKNKKEGHEHGH